MNCDDDDDLSIEYNEPINIKIDINMNVKM